MAILLQPSIKRFTSALMFTVPSSKRQPILGFVSVSCEQKQPFLKGGVKDWLIFRMAGIQNHSIYIYRNSNYKCLSYYISKYETMELFSIISMNVSVPHLSIYRIQLQGIYNKEAIYSIKLQHLSIFTLPLGGQLDSHFQKNNLQTYKLLLVRFATKSPVYRVDSQLHGACRL